MLKQHCQERQGGAEHLLGFVLDCFSFEVFLTALGIPGQFCSAHCGFSY